MDLSDLGAMLEVEMARRKCVCNFSTKWPIEWVGCYTIL